MKVTAVKRIAFGEASAFPYRAMFCAVCWFGVGEEFLYMLLKRNSLLRKFSVAKTLLTLLVASIVSAQSSVVKAQSTVEPVSTRTSAINYEENGSLSRQLGIPVYEWRKSGIAPRGIILAVHGLAMHGKSFDKLGISLADQGYLLVSTDLHGYGKYFESGHKFCSDEQCKEKTNYDTSYDDITRLATTLKKRYPLVPLFGLGESLGGAMAIRLAASHPELIDGLILAAPAIRHHACIDTNMVATASLCVANPRHQLDLTSFVKRYSSDDPRIVDEILADPLSRRTLSAYELLQASKAVHKTISFVPLITAETPVLVIQGSADKCVKAEAVMLLLSQLKSTDQTVKWFHERGHILLETSYIKPDTMGSVIGWLDTHVDSSDMQAKCHRNGTIALDHRSSSEVASSNRL